MILPATALQKSLPQWFRRRSRRITEFYGETNSRRGIPTPLERLARRPNSTRAVHDTGPDLRSILSSSDHARVSRGHVEGRETLTELELHRINIFIA